MKSEKTECTLYLNYDASVRLRPTAAAMEGFGIHVQNKEFSLQSLLNSRTYTFVPFGQQSRTTEGLGLPDRPRCFMTPETAEECQVLKTVMIL
jgi:hypothetical protein